MTIFVRVLGKVMKRVAQSHPRQKQYMYIEMFWRPPNPLKKIAPMPILGWFGWRWGKGGGWRKSDSLEEAPGGLAGYNYTGAGHQIQSGLHIHIGLGLGLVFININWSLVNRYIVAEPAVFDRLRIVFSPAPTPAPAPPARIKNSLSTIKFFLTTSHLP